MPNRKTFDDREKYDHSSHRTTGREKGDLAPVPNQEEERSSHQEKAREKNKNPRPRALP
jgi:hypothetical protein